LVSPLFSSSRAASCSSSITTSTGSH
jgi:hypothetical protein